MVLLWRAKVYAHFPGLGHWSLKIRLEVRFWRGHFQYLHATESFTSTTISLYISVSVNVILVHMQCYVYICV